MFQHILVPLDGSVLAEAALPVAAYWACACQARVTLMHIIEHAASATVHGERHLRQADEAETYLQAIARRAFPSEIGVGCHVHVEAATHISQAIVAHQEELLPDLIIMAVHGQHRLREAFWGNLAQQVVAFGDIPLLLIRPDKQMVLQPFECHIVLAPADGTAMHEPGLATAGEIAQMVGAKLHLLAVVPTASALSGRHATTQRFMPGATATMLDMVAEDLQTYLQERLAQFEQQGVAVSAEIRRGDPADVITEVADALNANLIVLGTHGKLGTAAFWQDSMGAKVVSHTNRPILLVPIKSEPSVR